MGPVLRRYLQTQPQQRIKRMGRRWYVYSLEQPGELLNGPSFATQREAIGYAETNAQAVLTRLRG